MCDARSILAAIKVASFGPATFIAKVQATEVKADGTATIVSTASLLFRGPGSYRLDMLSSTKAAFQGAKLIFHAGESTVSVRPGGVLKFLPLHLQLSDPQLLSLNGYRLDQVTGHGVLDRLSEPDYDVTLHGRASVAGESLQVLRVSSPDNRLDRRIAQEFIGFDDQHRLRLWSVYAAPALGLPQGLLYQMTVDDFHAGVTHPPDAFRL
ncbi:MAG: hypothetical protein H7338_18255 [Candidatus Sericytochromatia bacterium]|nr:hypothetical protein [Candidatus Sericytochromatia bacterium]